MALMFDVSKTLVHKAIHEMWLLLHQAFRSMITWLSAEEWESMKGELEELEEAVGTSHRIHRPTEKQALFYSGHRHIHCIHTQVIIDTGKKIRYIKSGFLGHNNDVMTYRLMDAIGPHEILSFLRDCYLLGDTIYPSEHPITTPYTARQLRNQNAVIRDQSKFVNEKIRARRVFVKHSIRRMKIYKIIGSLYRHCRNDIAPIVELCSPFSLRRNLLHD
ncbi:unnamed protein product [Mytilus coruscus]|uniref:DDE Tnp4 domain-containing protein n=1 Tax=Mytilus coruscus TaxID=42192 RepID=A0A6J8D118_MYTCO|nr:unnamed protein product [Mytilus coruscus]